MRGGRRVRPCPTPPFAGPSYPDVRCRFKWPGELPIDSVSCSDPSTRPAEADQAVRGPHNGLGNRPDPSRRCAASVQAAQGAPNGLEDRYDPCPDVRSRFRRSASTQCTYLVPAQPKSPEGLHTHKFPPFSTPALPAFAYKSARVAVDYHMVYSGGCNDSECKPNRPHAYPISCQNYRRGQSNRHASIGT